MEVFQKILNKSPKFARLKNKEAVVRRFRKFHRYWSLFNKVGKEF